MRRTSLMFPFLCSWPPHRASATDPPPGQRIVSRFTSDAGWRQPTDFGEGVGLPAGSSRRSGTSASADSDSGARLVLSFPRLGSVTSRGGVLRAEGRFRGDSPCARRSTAFCGERSIRQSRLGSPWCLCRWRRSLWCLRCRSRPGKRCRRLPARDPKSTPPRAATCGCRRNRSSPCLPCR